jgi:hypothetical protein
MVDTTHQDEEKQEQLIPTQGEMSKAESEATCCHTKLCQVSSLHNE